MKKPCSATDPLWYKDAIIYELHVRAFADSNADGIGDFQGLISKLDYLQELGVTCLWILPFFPSPLRDDGYDIADYTSVNPSYGTIADFQQFLDEAHARNMQVMIELVINHTSDQHPWFQRARHAPRDSPDRNMYVWSDSDKKFDGVRIIFTDTEKSNWAWDDVAQQYYWHRFFSHQPDLNFDNPRVMEEVLNAMRFWMDMGVDGLRLDAIPYLIERDGTSCENVPETHVLIKHIRSVMDAEYENRLILAEANMWPADVRPYFGDGDECQMAFHFPLMPRIYMALRQEDRLPITDIMAQTPPIPANCQWGLFLRNHDELTLEMVTDDERDYMNLAYASDNRMRINVGIRRRLAPLMDNNRRRIELLNSLLLSFPGTPIMYYGDEIGMGDNIYLGDRNGVRTPMQWNSDRNAGFSKAVPAKLYFPVIMDPIWGFQAINVEAQQSDASSLLHWTRNMIALRKIFQVFGRGTLEFLHPDNRKVLAYIRDYTGPEGEAGTAGHTETVLCVANLSRFAQPVALDLAKFAGRQPVEMLGYVPFPPINETPYAITLAPYSFFWLELQPAAMRSIQAPVHLTPDASPTTAIPDISTPAPATPVTLTGAPATPVIPTVAPTTPLISTEAPTTPVTPTGAPATTVISTEAPATPVISTEAPTTTVISTGAPATTVISTEAPAATVISTGAQRSGEIPASAPAPVTLAGLLETSLDRLSSVLPAYIAKQRWFGAKSRTIRSVGIASITPIDNTSLIAIVELTYGDGSTDLYQLPLAIASEPQAAELQASNSIIATLGTATIIDATASLTFRTALLNKITNPSNSPESSDLSTTRSMALDPQRLADVPSTLGSAEQSNTSILFDDLAILKLFRHVRTGENPDVEITRFLTEVAHFPHTPAYLGDLHLSSDATTLAFLQSFAPNQGDGWAWTLNELEGFYNSVASLPPPAPFNNQLPREILQHASTYLAAAELLGRRTAELHLALATPTSNAAFSPEPYTAEDLAQDRERIDRQATTALNALQTALQTSPGNLPPEAVELATTLLTHREALLERIQLLSGDPALFGQRIRIHGDFHLGQLLRVETKSHADFLIIDFEGEPARPFEERRHKQSPLRDVAGMLRSFSYAARSALQTAVQRTPANAVALEAWATTWETAVSDVFLRNYRSTLSINPALLPPPSAQDPAEHSAPALSALLLEKAFYELLYELNNRPTWLVIPLKGLLAIARDGA